MQLFDNFRKLSKVKKMSTFLKISYFEKESCREPQPLQGPFWVTAWPLEGATGATTGLNGLNCQEPLTMCSFKTF